MATFSQTVNYVCEKGFSFAPGNYSDNTRVLTCTANGSYNPPSLGTCQGKWKESHESLKTVYDNNRFELVWYSEIVLGGYYYTNAGCISIDMRKEVH